MLGLGAEATTIVPESVATYAGGSGGGGPLSITMIALLCVLRWLLNVKSGIWAVDGAIVLKRILY